MSGLKFASASSVSLWLNLELAATTVLGYLFLRVFSGLKAGLRPFLPDLRVILTVNREFRNSFCSTGRVQPASYWGFDNHFTALIDGISAVQSTFIKGLFAGTLNTAAGWYLSEKSVSYEFIFYALLLGSISIWYKLLCFI